MSNDASYLLHEARRRAGLSQRQLAARAGTAQSVVARIERGLTSPSWETLTRLLAAAGFDLSANLELRPVVTPDMLDDVTRILRLTPEDRLAELANFSRFATAAACA
ncbi:MAG TPA: helix-turn-helix transcriptional regulator [Gemmatimonadaceae bacterium]|nr:helix-turn-helix transcriptional regulator [Gemmatimonadaceae bacterium]